MPRSVIARSESEHNPGKHDGSARYQAPWSPRNRLPGLIAHRRLHTTPHPRIHLTRRRDGGRSPTTTRTHTELTTCYEPLTDEAAEQNESIFRRFRSSPLFELSRQIYPPGWTSKDHVFDPMLVNLEKDLRLRPKSPAIDAGETIPEDWPDPVHESDRGVPDIGALPFRVGQTRIGVNGRYRLSDARLNQHTPRGRPRKLPLHDNLA